MKGKEFREHTSGIFVAIDGEVFIPKSKTHPQRFSYGTIGPKGYLRISYSKYYYIHRLLAECWIDNPNNLPQIDHINRNRADNRIENLRWVSASENCKNRDSSKIKYNGLGKINNRASKPVLQYTLDGKFVKEWPSTMECRRNGYNQGSVSACCRGERQIYKGYIWQYKNKI